MMNYKFEENRFRGLLGDRLIRLFKDHNCIIAGGAITSLFCNREINDYDIYFRSKDDFVRFIYDIWGTENWITSSTDKATGIMVKDKVIQAIHFKYFENIEDIFKTFDFTACMGAYDFKTEEFVLHEDFLKHNSQRILSFNKETAFPIVSLLRVDKYKSKGYKISKSEMIKIALTCMKLSDEVDSYDKLKSQIGGMYGKNYDKLFDGFADDEEFDLSKAIDYLSEIPFDEDVYKENDPINFNSVEEFLFNVVDDLGWKYFTLDDSEYYLIMPDGEIERVYEEPKGCERIDAKEFVKNLRLCKFVKKVSDGKYSSFYDNKFTYTLGEIVEPENKFLFFNNMRDLAHSTFYLRDDKVCIEVEFEYDDIADLFSSYRSEIKLTKCRVLREVPEEEWRRAVDKEDDNPFLPFCD